ncbi:MAG: hypothetical protein QM692_01975 [Thermomicrobiales bacterium]
MAAERKFAIVQEDGLVLLPAGIHLEAGDVLPVEETESSLILSLPNRKLDDALDRLGLALREAGIDLDTFIEDGREIRGDLLRERYGIDLNQLDKS